VGGPGGQLQLHLSVVPLRGPVRLRLGLRLALDSRDVHGTGLLLGLVGGDALRGLVRTGLEFVQPVSAVTWLVDIGVAFCGWLRRLPLRRPRLPGLERCLLFACDRTVDGR